MVLRCIACGAENPATQFYCGQCGTKLQQHTPEHDSRERGGETEVEARTKEEAERKKRTEIARWKEIELESRGIFMPWNIKDAGSDPARDAANDKAIADAASEPRTSQPPDRLNVPARGERVEGQNTVATSKPSAPGLTNEAAAQQQARDRVVESHSRREVSGRNVRRNIFRRNMALAVLAAAAILAAFEWRTIGDTVVPYVQNTIQQAWRHDVPAAAPPDIAADNASPAPVEEPPVAAGRLDGSTGSDVGSARSGNAPVAGAAEMYQAAHATNAKLRVAWLWKAVRAGNPQAPVELAKMYEDGEGVAQSCEQALILLSAAAAQGNAQAKLELQQLPLSGACSEQ